MEYCSAIKKKWNLAICNDMDGPRGYYANWSKSDRERQIPYDLAYMWNLKDKTNEQTKQKQTHRYREQTGDCQVGKGLGAENGEGISKYKLVITKYSRGCEVQHREYSQ